MSVRLHRKSLRFNPIKKDVKNLKKKLAAFLNKNYFKGYCSDNQAAGWGGSDSSQVCQVPECSGAFYNNSIHNTFFNNIINDTFKNDTFYNGNFYNKSAIDDGI